MTKNNRQVQALDEFADELLPFETTGTFFTPQEIRILREAISGTVQTLRLQAADLKRIQRQLERALTPKQTAAQIQAGLLSENVVLFPLVARPVPAATEKQK